MAQQELDLQPLDLQPVEEEELDLQPLDLEPLSELPDEEIEEDPSVWETLTEPLWRGPERFAQSIADYIDQPSVERSPLEAMIRGGLAGMIGGTEGADDDRWRGAGGLLSDITSPIELAGLGIGGAAKVARPAIRGLAGLARRGDVAEEVIEEAPKLLPEPHHRFVGGVGRTEGGRFGRVIEDIAQQPEGGVIRDFPDIDVTPTKVVDEVSEVIPERMPPVARLNDAILGGTKLGQADLDDIAKVIGNAELNLSDKTEAFETLNKLLKGEHPSVKEMNRMNKIFGEEIPLPKKKASIATEIANLPRAMQSSMDISAPFRQGLGLIHTGPWWKSWGAMVRSFGKEKAYEGVMDSIRNNPLYDVAQDSGVNFTDLRHLSTREEAIMNTWAEKVPWVRRSNRAYTAFLNKIRMDVFSNLVNDARIASKTAIRSAGDNRRLIEEAQRLDPDLNPKLVRDIAKYVNNASGRGDLGKASKYAQELNTIFYSPRFIASRVQMLNPANYISAEPFVRRQYLKSMAAITGTWGGIAGLASLGGADVSMEPTSADFGKIRIGDTRIDPGGGFQQYLVLFNRLARQETTSSTSGRTREFGEGYHPPTSLKVGGRFLTNKLQPLAKFAWDAAGATEDAPFHTLDRTAQLFIPMIVQDLIEVSRENPALLGFTIPATAVGMGSSTYGPDDWAQPEFIGEGALIDPGSF